MTALIELEFDVVEAIVLDSDFFLLVLVPLLMNRRIK